MKSDFNLKLSELEAKVVNIVLPLEAREQYKKGKISHKLLNPHVSELKLLSENYLAGRQVLMNQTQVAAYALYYLSVNYAKLCFLIDQIRLTNPEFGLLAGLNVLDFGCGPGSGLAACLSSNFKLNSLTALDASKDCLKFTEKFFAGTTPGVTFTACQNLQNIAGKKYDLIIAANVLTELSDIERSEVLQLMQSILEKNAYLLILEPAQFKTTRKLMQTREHILKSFPALSVEFPCTINTSCPMLADRKKNDDWCHGILPSKFWEASHLIQDLDELLGFNKHRIKYSALILKNSERQIKTTARVIRTAGKIKTAEICTEKGLLQIRTSQIKDVEDRRALKAADNYRSVSLSNLKKL